MSSAPAAEKIRRALRESTSIRRVDRKLRVHVNGCSQSPKEQQTVRNASGLSASEQWRGIPNVRWRNNSRRPAETYSRARLAMARVQFFLRESRQISSLLMPYLNVTRAAFRFRRPGHSHRADR